MKKYFNIKFITTLIIYTAIVKMGTVMAWEMIWRAPILDWWESEKIVVEREEVVFKETEVEQLEDTRQAIEAGEKCRVEEAKRMRLEDLAEEAKTLQAELDDPLI